MFKQNKIVRAINTRDGYMTLDRATIDSAGAFLVSELERLDPRIYDPLVSVTWSRDIDLRSDVTLGDEFSSFSNSTYAAAGGPSPNGKSWIGLNTNEITSILTDINKTATPLTPWGMQTKWSVFEAASAANTGRPIDETQFRALMLKYNMDVDEQVYIGDPQVVASGLLNNPNVPVAAAAAVNWATATPAQILADLNDLLNTAWANSGYALMPNRVLLPPRLYSYLAATLISTAGNQSILRFLLENNISLNQNATPLQIFPSKWCVAAGATASFDRIVAYTKDPSMIRLPLVPLQRSPLEFEHIHWVTTYYGKIGAVEIPRLEAIVYKDVPNT